MLIMQNYLIQQPLESPIHRAINSLKDFLKPKRHVPLKPQLMANELITRLEFALNSENPATIQINNSLLSEDVTNYFGYVYQNIQGQILIQSPLTHQMVTILPGTIRHISFN